MVSVVPTYTTKDYYFKVIIENIVRRIPQINARNMYLITLTS